MLAQLLREEAVAAPFAGGAMVGARLAMAWRTNVGRAPSYRCPPGAMIETIAQDLATSAPRSRLEHQDRYYR